MTTKEASWSAVLAILLGLLVLKWKWLAEIFGTTITIERTGSMITIEYLRGMLAVAVLGYLFYELPVWVAVWFMLGPTLFTHAIHVLRSEIPNQWALEIFILALLTIPK